MTTPLIFHWLKRWDERITKIVCFYPDVFDLDYDADNYQLAWAELAQRPDKGRYLMANEGHLTRVGLLRFWFERVLGFLGFSNDCDPAKVTMAAQKLLYYGYLNGYNQTAAKQVLQGWDEVYKPKQDYVNLCDKPRMPTTSAALQSQLITYYRAHAVSLNAPKQALAKLPLPHQDPNFVFGSTYAQNHAVVQALQVDVQHEPLIKQLLPLIQSPEQVLPHSTACRLYVEQQLEQIKQIVAARKKQKEQDGILQSIKRFFSVKPHESFELLQRRANDLLQHYPALGSRYTVLFIQLKLGFAQELSSHTQFRKKEALYREALQQISALDNATQRHDFLYDYFMTDESFRLLDSNLPYAQEFARFLVETKLNQCQGEARLLCEYRIAELAAALIADADLPPFINACLAVLNYPLAFELIKRLANPNRERAVQFIQDNRGKLLPLLKAQKQQVPQLAAIFAMKVSEPVSQPALSENPDGLFATVAREHADEGEGIGGLLLRRV